MCGGDSVRVDIAAGDRSGSEQVCGFAENARSAPHIENPLAGMQIRLHGLE